MERAEMASLYFLHRVKGVGNRTLWKIKQEWGSFRGCCEASHSALGRSSLPALITEAIIEGRKETDPQLDLDKMEDSGVRICSIEDEGYPALLTYIFDPPYLLYYRGDLGISTQFCLGVVGSRKATAYGKVQTRRLSRDIVEQGWVIVSGMARGIDTEAHQGALENNGKTIAVLGSGHHVIYPPENLNLYKRICQCGLVISEFPPLARPEPGHFPQRNRTLAGLCRGVLVVEARLKSGALITADYALEQGREVFAVPGPINSPNSTGTNNLIRQGACLVSGIEDILSEYGIERQENKRANPKDGLEPRTSDDEENLMEALGFTRVHRDVLSRQTGWEPGRLSALLLKLELEGIIKALPGNYYIKT